MHFNGDFFLKVDFLKTIEAKVIILTVQRRSHLFLFGAADIERRMRECERRRRKAILGGSGGMPPPPRKIFKQTVRFRAFWDDFKQ